MTAPTPAIALVTIQPVFAASERLALAGFVAGYRGQSNRGAPGSSLQRVVGELGGG